MQIRKIRCKVEIKVDKIGMSTQRRKWVTFSNISHNKTNRPGNRLGV
jgi:hypothetical protein